MTILESYQLARSESSTSPAMAWLEDSSADRVNEQAISSRSLEIGRESRMYKTGDLARYRSDGTIEFIGRTDHQIKIRGFRVELAEIESILTQTEGVAQAVVVARENESRKMRFVAYVVLQNSRLSDFPGTTPSCALENRGGGPNAASLRKALRKVSQPT